jgi:CspA family cold shock protein
MMEQGKVRWFDSKKGYGIISRSSGEDVLVHHSALAITGPRPLNEEDIIEFEVVGSHQGSSG